MPENTTDRDPLLHLLGAMSEGSSGYIEGMERDGQRQLVGSESFPARAPIAELEALGFMFGPVDERDPLFRSATLPTGWTRHGTDHAMWSEIRDEKGRKRVSIFYKAAFYDRDAFASLVHPAAPLGDLMYDDDIPTAVQLDDLLTADVARAWCTTQEEHIAEHLAIVAPNGPVPERKQQQLDRIGQIRTLVETAAARGTDATEEN